VLANILSITAIVLSVVSIAWQVKTWRESGPVVQVTANQAFLTYGPEISDPHVDVTATNKGRAPITVKSWGLELPGGQHMAMLEYSRMSASLPHRLEPGADASWYVETKTVTEKCASEGVRYQDLTAYVTLGDGRTVKARRRGIGWA
jgi:hypothetical protein